VAAAVDGRHRHCGAILQGTKSVMSQDNVMEVQFHSDENDNTSQDFRHATRLLKGVWLHFTPGQLINLHECCDDDRRKCFATATAAVTVVVYEHVYSSNKAERQTD